MAIGRLPPPLHSPKDKVFVTKAQQREILVQGAREHNLRGIDVAIPRGSLTTVTGVSGSGKSSLAFDTIFKEGQRRFVESLSAYARQFLGQGEKPRVDHIEGLSPTVSIDQKTVSKNPRSTVGTITEVQDHLRLLFARLGQPHCPEHGTELVSKTPEEVVDRVLEAYEGSTVMVLAPLVKDRKGEYRKELEELLGQGFVRARIDGEVRRLDEPISLERNKRHTIEAVMDRIAVRREKRGRIAEAVEAALRMGRGHMSILAGEVAEAFSQIQACPLCGTIVPELEPRFFSYNSPHGACTVCDGLGRAADVDPSLVIPDQDLSIDEGAIRPSVKGGWNLRRHLRPEILRQVCDELKIPRDVPWKKLSERRRRLLLFGAGRRKIPISLDYEGKRLKVRTREKRLWEGVIPLLRRLHARRPSRTLERFMAPSPCPACRGRRLRPEALAVLFRGRSIGDLAAMTVDGLLEFLSGIALEGREKQIGARLFRELVARLRFLSRVGVGYLTLDRSAASLSGGEAQRIRLATQVGSCLRGILYVLDEPSIGLHARDNRRLIETLQGLRDAGNTVLVVEHDEETIEASDHVVDVGPGAGREGGNLVHSGTPAALARNRESLTGAFLAGRETIPLPEKRRPPGAARIVVKGARENNLAGIDVPFPLGLFSVVTGVSGSGKSTLVDTILKRALARRFHGSEDKPGRHLRITGLQHLDKVVEVDQAPIGRTPRSNPATYTKVFDLIRDLFAELPESKVRGYPKGRFSFNVKGGRCEECNGAGVRLVEMHFLPDVEVPCDTCNGRRFNSETLEIHYRGKSISDVLDMTVEEAREFFRNHPKIVRVLDTLHDVGLSYMRLGQPSTTLSGGEAQRVKLARHLHRPPTGRTLYLLDEPTTGLHFLDVRRLIGALQRLVDQGNTVIVIEHNLDVIKCADWIVDLGPEGGAGGGRLIYAGEMEGILDCPESHTGRALAAHLGGRARGRRPRRRVRDRALEGGISIKGASLHNLKDVDAEIPAGSLTVVTGPSGSGKTSLAFDTLFAEGQRRFVECLSTYARQFLGRMERPPVEAIDGLAPAIAIDQKNSGRNPRSTVATVTEIHDYLRILFARVGRAFCPSCGEPIQASPPSAVWRTLLAECPEARGRVLAPLWSKSSAGRTLLSKAADLKTLVPRLREEGFVRLLLNGKEYRLDEKLPPPSRLREILLVVDRLQIKPSSRVRLLDSISQAYDRGLGVAVFETVAGRRVHFTEHPGCVKCGFQMEEELSPRMFSFNSHAGACPGCHGLGERLRCDPDLLIARPEKPLFRRAMVDKPGDFIARRDSYLRKVVQQIAETRGIDLGRPWKRLPEDFRHAVMHGLEEDVLLTFSSRKSGGGTSWEMRTRWKGFCHYVEDWHESTSNEWWAEILEGVMRRDLCSLCGGERLAPLPRSVKVEDRTIGDVGRMTVAEALAWVESLDLGGSAGRIAADVLRELRNRLGFLDAVGLDYLSLGRSAATLSGGEAQRIRLATQIGNRLTGVIYVLDEPTIGLHPRDTGRLLGTLKDLRDLGNTVVVVEHDRDTIDQADWILDLGPGAGHHGGEIVYQGDRRGLERAGTLTADYLSGRRSVPTPPERRKPGAERIRLKSVRTNNLRDVTLNLPVGCFVAVTGVSGSGKSSLVMDSLAPAMLARLAGRTLPAGVGGLSVPAAFERCVIVDQDPIGTSPRSNPATYIGVMDDLRRIMAMAPLAKMRGYGPGRFSFNMAEGRCAACDGRGSIKVEMHFLPDVWITCETCGGRRFNRQTLEVRYRGRTIADMLEMEVSEALPFFANHSAVRRRLQLLEDVGLGYMKLGQASTTLSGGEAQRIKLARELSLRVRGKALYLLDEPTTGLHFDDVARLVSVLHRLVDAGHTVVVIEHNEDVLKSADWIIDLGPEGGTGGGRIVAEGPPEAIARCSGSHTGRHLARLLEVKAGGVATGPSKRETLETIT